jgi:hypothetical protein
VSDTLKGQATPRLVVPAYTPEAPGTHPPLDFPDYRSTRLRHPGRPLVPLPHRLTEVTSTPASRWGSGSSSRDGSWTAAATRSPAPWSRSGRPTPAAATATTATGIPPPWTPTSAAPAAASRMPRAATGS